MIYTNKVTEMIVEYILTLQEVLDAKKRVDTLQEGSISFHIALNPLLTEQLSQTFGITLSGPIPMRWIKGDTKPHIDKASNLFDKTHLVYLTDSVGNLVIDGEMFPISKGSAYVFNEGLQHETVGTGMDPRLLLGPMSEQGVAVGGGLIIYADGETQTIYIRYNTDTLENEYRIDEDPWSTLYLPAGIYNTNAAPTNNILKCIFTTDIHINGSYIYFICATSGIQFGSTSLNSDGTRPKIMVEDVLEYQGLIQNTENSSIYIFNLEVHTVGTCSLAVSAGWIGQTNFGVRATNNYIINCDSNGDISLQGGGIIGANAALGDGTANSSSLYIIGCSSSGAMGDLTGGIAGYNAGSDGGYIKCEQCWSTGTINGTSAGGIFGKSAASSSGETVALKCYSTGTISGEFAGGIFGQLVGTSGTTTAEKCYSQGIISGDDAGGIYGSGAGSDGGVTSAINCYSSGAIGTIGNGIYSGGENPSSRTITNCYVANANWTDSQANTYLVGTPNYPSILVGTNWVAVSGENNEYYLNGMGYTPYQIQNILSQTTLNQSYSQTIAAGETTSPSIKYNNNYTILQISGGSSSSFTMNSVSGEISTTTATLPATYTITLYNSGSYNITTFALTVIRSVTPNLPICFPAGTPVLTDQGEVAIDKINKKIHTIGGKEIVAITESIPLDSYLICMERNSLGRNVPNRRTLISKDHKVKCDKKMVRAEYLVEYVPGVYRVPYNKQRLYNVVLKEHSTMTVNNMVVETMHPENILAKIYAGNYTPEEKNNYILIVNNSYFKQRRNSSMKHNIATK